MILDYRNMGENERRYRNGKVLVDGEEVRLVFYVDTEAGIVKSYDVFGDARVHTCAEVEAATNPPARRLELADGICFKTLHGKVELIEPVAAPSC